MSFTKADLEKEKDELNRLISEDEDVRKAHQEFQARIALQQKLIQMRKAERMTQEDVSSTRMLDCEFVNRFLAFYLLDIEKYNDNLEEYLNKALLMLKKAPAEELDRCRRVFYSAMKMSCLLFGKRAFRKQDKSGRYGKINKPLFECVSVCLARLSDRECEDLVDHKDLFLEKYSMLLQDPAFIDVITNGTAKKNCISKRNTEMRRIISETISLC